MSPSSLRPIFAALVLVSAVAAAAVEAKTVTLTEDTWREMLDGEWMVAFVAPWCPACKSLHATWAEFGDWSADLNIRVGQVDITENPGLSGRFMVTALPTIYHVKDGVFRQYQAGRDRDSLMSFVEAKKWSQLKPVSAWKQPDSLQMSTVAQFFRWSYQIRAVHQQLVDRGIPYWASYGLFALATIIVGAVLGLLIVACIDYVFPPKAIDYRRFDEAAAAVNAANDAGHDSSDLAEGDDEDAKKTAKKSPKAATASSSPDAGAAKSGGGSKKKSKKID